MRLAAYQLVAYVTTIVTVILASSTPSGPYDTDTIAGCTWWVDNYGQLTCHDVRDLTYAIPPATFSRWNPSITLDCGNWKLQSYCVEVASERPNITTSSLPTLDIPTSTTSTVRPSPTSWEPLYCYKYEPMLAFTTTVIAKSSDLTIAKCETACWDSGFAYAALKAGTDCLCDSFAGNEVAKDKNACNTPCSGDKSEACGGSEAVTAFEAHISWPQLDPTTSVSTTPMSTTSTTATPTSDPIPGWRPMGCYEESDIGVLGYEVDVVGGAKNMTRENCCDACRKADYKFAGFKNGDACFCDIWTPVSERVELAHWYATLIFLMLLLFKTHGEHCTNSTC